MCNQKQEEFLYSAKLIHGNRYSYEKTIFHNIRTKVVITCPIHGDFLQSPIGHIHNKQGCKKCSDNKRRNSLETFIEKANSIHNGIYDYSLVEYKNNRTHIKIICPEHGLFEQTPNNHINRKCGCPKCKIKSQYLDVETFIEKANKIYNHQYDYSLMYQEPTNSYYQIRCIKHDFIFKIIPSMHLSGKQKCPLCNKEKTKLTQEKFIKRSKIIHKNYYMYDLVNFKNLSEKVTITCPVHGNFTITPNAHLYGKQGCKKCSDDKKRHSLESFIQKANSIHNGVYDYSLVNYKNIRLKVEIVCLKHGTFLQTPDAHLSGCGCPKCNISVSKKETKWLDSLGITIRQYKIPNTKFIVDGYDPETNTCYEFYGSYWHGCPKTYNPDDINIVSNKTFGELYSNTLKREKELRNLGYNIVHLWECDCDDKIK